MFTAHVRSKSISTHEADEVLRTQFFHPDGVNRHSHALGSSFSPGSGPSFTRRAQAIPDLPGRVRGLRTKEMRAKRRGKFPRVVWPRLVGKSGRSSSSSSRLPRIVVCPAHRLPRAVKAAADGRPATRRDELMPARLYIAAYRAWPATFVSIISPNRPPHLLHPPPRAMAGYRSACRMRVFSLG
jgi:hypothetical protein